MLHSYLDMRIWAEEASAEGVTWKPIDWEENGMQGNEELREKP